MNRKSNLNKIKDGQSNSQFIESHKEQRFLDNLVKTNNDIVYYNVVISHDPNVVGPSQAIYTDNRAQNIVDQADQYVCSVVRFSAPGSSIPILNAYNLIQSGSTQTNPNLMSAVVTLTYMGTDYSVPLIYTPSVAASYYPVPPAPSTNPPSYTAYNSPYYYIFTYNDLLNMINTALRQAYDALNTANPDVVGPTFPYFTYDAETALISLFVPIGFVDDAVPPGTAIATISINTPLIPLLGGFLGTYNGYNLATGDNKNFTFDIRNWPGAATEQNGWAGGMQLYFVFEQSFNTLCYWNSLQSIAFTVGGLPVVMEAIPANFQAGQNNNYQSGANASRPILTDFIADLSQPGAASSILIYSPTGPWRLIDLYGQNPIRNLQIQAWWVDYANSLNPILLFPGQELTMKIAFIRKEYYKAGNK